MRRPSKYVVVVPMEPLSQPAPLSPPTWLTPARLSQLAIAIAAGSAAIPALARVDHALARDIAPSLIVCTTLLCVVLARWALRSKHTVGVVSKALLGGAMFGALNAGLVLFIQLLQEGKGSSALFGLFAGTFIGGVIGAPLGFAFGAAFSPVLLAANRARNEPTLDALEPVLLASGAFLALAGAFTGWHHTLPFRFVGLALVIVGFACAALAFTRDLARLAWMRAVRAGRLREYEIVPRTDEINVLGLLPVFRSPGALPEGVLTRISIRGSGAPFRTMGERTPIARVHLRADEEKPLARRRMAVALLVMVLAGACALSPYMSTRQPGDLALNQGMGSWN